MTPIGVLYLILMILVFVLICYLILLVVERAFGPLDPTIKSVAGVLILILLLLYVLQHLGVMSWR